MKKVFVIICSLCLCFVKGSGQAMPDYPEINKPFPGFTLKKIKYFPKKQLSLNDLKGQYFILDFWSDGCASCIAAFPKMNALQQKFRDRLQVVLVAPESKHRDIEAFYEAYKQKYGLNLACAFDSSFFYRIVPRYVPHIIWVDNQGIVKAITSTPDVSEGNIEKFLKGEPFEFVDRSYAALQSESEEPKADLSAPLGIKVGATGNYLFRSLLQQWEKGMGKDYARSIESYIKEYKKPQFQEVKLTLRQLYDVAYYGEAYNSSLMFEDTTTYYQAIIDTKDSALFRYGYPGQPFYNYSVEIPGTVPDAGRLRRIMQADLKNFFGYEAAMVYKYMPCLKLVVIDKAKADQLKAEPGSKSTNQWRDESTTNFFKNQRLGEIIRVLVYKVDGVKSGLAFDETGITDPVNLTINAHIWDLEGIRKSLQQQGLDLVWGTKRLKVLEIRDSKYEMVD